jgi:AraC family transcriptional regulator, transcriptional activator of pobA
MSKRIAQLSLSKFADLYADKLIGPDFFITDEKQLLELSEYPYRSDGYIIGICTRGTAEVEVNLQVYQARPDAMLLATPFHILRIYNSSDDFLCRFIVFSKAFLMENNVNSHFLESFSYFKSESLPVIYPDHPDAKMLLDVYLLIQQKLEQEEHPYRQEISRSILTTLLYEVEFIYEKQHVIIKGKQNRKQELNLLFQNLVFRHYKEHRNVQFYADALFVSSKHLTETIKEVTGRTSGEWIEDAVILEAKVLLRNHEISIAQVAENIHFPDQSSFGKYFKKHTGLSPSDYRMVSTH